MLHAIERERVVSGRNRGVRREDRCLSYALQRLVEAVAVGDQLVNALQHDERGVSLIQMPDVGGDAKSAQRTHAAYAENDFLLEARFAIAAVEARR